MAANWTITQVRITKDGGVKIPLEYRRSLGLKVGQKVMLQLVDDTLVLMSPLQAIRRAQKLVRKTVSHDASLVE